MNKLDMAKTVSNIVQAREWKNGRLQEFVSVWLDKGILAWDLTDVPEKDRHKFEVFK